MSDIKNIQNEISEEQIRLIYEKTANNIKLAEAAMNYRSGLEYFGIISFQLEKIIFKVIKDFQSCFSSSAHAATDGQKIYFYANDLFKAPDIMFVLVHEIIHLVSSHPIRRQFRDGEIYQLACDHVANSLIMSIILNNKHTCGLYIRWQNFAFLDRELMKINPKISVDGAYDYFMKKNKNGGFTITRKSLGDINERQIIEVVDNITGDKFEFINDVENIEKFKLSQSEIEDKTKDIVDTANQYYSSQKNFLSRGKTPLELIEYLDVMFKVEVPWYILVEKAIMYLLQNRQDRSWASLNDVYLPLNMYMPGNTDAQELASLIICKDVSGSIGTDDLKRFVSIICSGNIYFKKIYVITHGVLVHDIHIFSDTQDLTEEHMFDVLSKIKGRDGTSHVDAFKKIGEIFEEEPNISLVVYLTDFYSDINNIYQNPCNSWIKELSNIFIINNTNIKVDLDGIEYKVFRLINEKVLDCGY